MELQTVEQRMNALAKKYSSLRRGECAKVWDELIDVISSFQSGKMRCDKCAQSISRLEIKFKSFLQENNINFLFFELRSAKQQLKA